MSSKSLLDYIARYVQLTEAEQEVLLQRVIPRRYLKGQFVVQQGDVCKVESFVLKGCLKTFYTDPEGQEHIVMFAIENWWTADLGSFITQTPADYNVQCLEDSELLQFPYDALEELYQTIPKLERFFRIIIQKAFVASEKRNIRNVSQPAKERYLQFKKQYPQIEQRVPQYMIASYLGITKEFLSKIRSQLIHSPEAY
ncbi:MAG: Crp/Fnr family transcriptional regulator [Rufibacter sp.]